MSDLHMQQGWHITKNITLSHLFTTIFVLVGGVVSVVELQGKVDVSAAHIDINSTAIKKVEASQVDSKSNAAAIQRIEKQQNIQYTEIIRRLERISDKLDTKADK